VDESSRSASICAASKCSRAMGTKFKGGSKNDAAACVGDILIGTRPGGRVGVLLASGGSNRPGGGVWPEAYGLVTYEASETMDGIASRRFAFGRRLSSLLALPSFGDPFDASCLVACRPLAALPLEGGLPPEPGDLLLISLMGGWLWNRQKTWYREARSFAAMTLSSRPCSPSWQYGKM
jgi:hypothetical protein